MNPDLELHYEPNALENVLYYYCPYYLQVYDDIREHSNFDVQWYNGCSVSFQFKCMYKQTIHGVIGPFSPEGEGTVTSLSATVETDRKSVV